MLEFAVLFSGGFILGALAAWFVARNNRYYLNMTDNIVDAVRAQIAAMKPKTDDIDSVVTAMALKASVVSQAPPFNMPDPPNSNHVKAQWYLMVANTLLQAAKYWRDRGNEAAALSYETRARQLQDMAAELLKP
jgi:hypothetical protein